MIRILLGAFLISFSSVFVKLVHVGPTSALFYRFLFGALALFFTAKIKGIPLFKGFRPFIFAMAAGAIFALDLFFWHRSIHYIGPGLATILANLQIFILAAAGVLFMKERLSVLFIISSVIAFIGLVILIGPDIRSAGPLFKRGILFGLITSCCYSGLTLTIQKSRKLPVTLPPVSNMAWLCFFGMLTGTPGVLYCGESFIIPDLESLIFLAAYGVICSGVGWYLITKGLSQVPVSLAGLALTLQPTFAFVWDILFFSRPVTVLNISGALITIAAIYTGSISRHSR